MKLHRSWAYVAALLLFAGCDGGHWESIAQRGEIVPAEPGGQTEARIIVRFQQTAKIGDGYRAKYRIQRRHDCLEVSPNEVEVKLAADGSSAVEAEFKVYLRAKDYAEPGVYQVRITRLMPEPASNSSPFDIDVEVRAKKAE